MPSKRSENPVKIVLDTNNLVSAQINKKGDSFKIFNLFQKGQVSLYISPFQLKEFQKVDFIISGDEHLLSLKKFRNIPIISALNYY